MDEMNHIANFVKYSRSKLGITQEELSGKAGVGLRFVRELEQGKETLRLDKVNQVLALFGYQVVPGLTRLIDPYDILMNHSNRAVYVYLKNKNVLTGIIIDSITDNNEIKAWRFVAKNKALEYKKSEDPALVQRIEHTQIERVENI